MLVTAVVLPHPPLLVPDVAAGAAVELRELRDACLEALTHVNGARRDGSDVVVVGGGRDRATFGPGAPGSFAGFGVPLEVTLPGDGAAERPRRSMPLSLSVASWLMQQVGGWGGVGGSVRAESVPFALTTGEATALGHEWATTAERLALVAMGDGSNALSAKAPGYLVPGAEEWQSVVTAALGNGDAECLASLHPDDADRFGAAGRAAWQVLAGAAAGAGVRGKLLAVEERYGVAYVVAQWSATDPVT